jgi:hypothetical protein
VRPLSDLIGVLWEIESVITELYIGRSVSAVVVVVPPDNGTPYPIWVLYIFVFASMGFVISLQIHHTKQH